MRRLRILAGLIGVAGVVLYLSAYAGLLRLAYPEAWLMITIATLASVYGYWAGIGAALVALALDAHFEVDHNLLEPLVIYVISAFLAAWLGHQLRQTYRQKRQALRQLTLLVQAQNTLSDLSSREAVFSALPNLLGQYGEGHVSLWQPQAHGFRLVSAFAFEGWPDQLLPENGVVGRAFHQARTLYVPDVRLEPDYVQAPPGQTLAELALPLWEGEEVVAVLNLERPGPFMDEELDALKLFAATASRRLTRLSEQARLSLLDELSQTLNSTPSLKSMAQRALPLLASGLEVEAGALMQQQGSRLVILAQWGPLPPSQQHLVEEGIPFGQGLSWVV